MNMIKRLVKRAFVITSILSVFILASGCASDSQAKDNAGYAIVVGAHSNGRVIPFNSETVQNALTYISYRHAYVTFINCDRDPEPYFQTKIPESSVKNLSAEKQKRIAESYVKQLTEIIGQATPDSSEVDTLKAIQKAAQGLGGLDGADYDKDLLILDSGLSTSGYMDFTSGMLYADPQDVVAALEEVNAIPDLSGVDVTWSFCGEVASPQKELTVDERDNLKKIWEAVLVKGGANKVIFTNDFSSAEAYQGMPLVSTVEVGEEKIVVNADLRAKAPVINVTDPIETVVLDNASVQFVGDKDVFLNESIAREKIEKVARLLDEHPENQVYVIGTTASGRNDESFCQDLSERRAKAVVEVLKEMGIDEDRMIPVGLGFTDHWHIEDIDGSGNWIEENAAKNRKVMIIDVNSEDASFVS